MDIIKSIKSSLSEKILDTQYQDLMSPVGDSRTYREKTDHHKVACVMALIHKKADKELYITYIVRAASHPDDKHAGQIGFPGGKHEDNDNSLLDCALREVEEEIGIGRDRIQVLGQLSTLFVAPSNFLVYPYIGFIENEPTYIAQQSEVADILEVSLEELFAEHNKQEKTLTLGSGIESKVPGYDVKGHFLWGATAMMTSELEHIYADSK